MARRWMSRWATSSRSRYRGLAEPESLVGVSLQPAPGSSVQATSVGAGDAVVQPEVELLASAAHREDALAHPHQLGDQRHAGERLAPCRWLPPYCREQARH